ncbi:MAG: helicase RepA family protein [Rickettsia endosymbiont of Culicoides impunctatus]|nr:MAG: helicase RepA family protein [Rickettsia endosymbiont of Culicoides impunctatus]UCM85543.1 MAG: helicase RepA family protein [Rickettsia endosymbiont of Culicoides impunctatus]
MSAGKEFVGFKPARPLRIFYLQTEIGYHYMRERLQNIQLPKELLDKAETNLHITANNRLLLDEQGVNIAAKHIRQIFPEHPPDIIAIDPIRNSFDGGRHGSTENENDAMMFFLKNRIELLRDKINPHTGIILVHHTKKISRIQFEDDPFQAFSGASSLRGYYTSGILLYKPEIDSNNRHLIFELRNGKEIGNKIIHKVAGIWEELNPMEKRIAYKVKGKLYDRERERRIKVIIKLLEADALRGKFYLMKQFAQKYQNYIDLGGRRAIYDDCSVAATQGVIKFFDNPEEYGIKLASVVNASFGYICTENMMMEKEEVINIETGETIKNYIQIPPTHYKCDGDGRKKKILNNNNWQTDLEKIGENTVNKTNLKCSS